MGLTIDPKSKIFGLDLKTGRDLVKRLRHYAQMYPTDDINYVTEVRSIGEIVLTKEKQRCGMGYSLTELNPNAVALAPDLIQKMLDEGYLTVMGITDHNGFAWYQVTAKGAELSRHKLIKRLPRAKAVQKLEEFLERVEEWNACEPYVWVQDVWLYGSLITNAPDVGDIDLVCKYTQNPDSPDMVTEGEHIYFIATGKDEYAKVKKFLRGGSPYISLVGFSARDIDKIQGGYIQIVKDRQVAVIPWENGSLVEVGEVSLPLI